MAEAEPKFLNRLQQIITKHHTLGTDEQDYSDTAAYAEQFIQQVVPLRDKEAAASGQNATDGTLNKSVFLRVSTYIARVPNVRFSPLGLLFKSRRVTRR